MNRSVILTLAAALVALATAATFAQDEGPPLRPETHGSLINGGAPASLDVLVVGCQGFAVPVARVILLGKEAQDNSAAGLYHFTDLEPGAYRLYVYGDVGTAYEGDILITDATAFIRAEVLLDMCIETELTAVSGTVRKADGKPAKHVRVAVEDLFLETETDGQGFYELLLPPGDWTITADGDTGAVSARITSVAPDESGGGYAQYRTLDLQL